jgi:2-polyprenyl-3-methyl-5-hydroxy-6-metoxy-1,4-benzoquinol methylase
MDKLAATIKTYNKCAVAFQNKFMEMDLYNNSYNHFCNRVEITNPRILEIACGPGNITKYLLSKRPDFNILAIDLAEKMVELAKKNNPTADFRVMDCRDILSLHEKFDAIICGFCMPYLSNEECSKLIADMAVLLNPGGTVYFSTMEGNDSRSGFENTSFSGENQVYVYYHQSEFLKNQLEKYGFENIELMIQEYPEPDGTFTNDLIFLARKIGGINL